MGNWTDADGKRRTAELHKAGRMDRLPRNGRPCVVVHPQFRREVGDNSIDCLAEGTDRVCRTKLSIPFLGGKNDTSWVHMPGVMHTKAASDVAGDRPS
jgi:hypothetical protein